LRCTTW